MDNYGPKNNHPAEGAGARAYLSAAKAYDDEQKALDAIVIPTITWSRAMSGRVRHARILYPGAREAAQVALCDADPRRWESNRGHLTTTQSKCGRCETKANELAAGINP